MELRLPSKDLFYSSLEALVSAMNQHASGEGYVVTIKHSEKSKKGSSQGRAGRYGRGRGGAQDGGSED